MSPSDRCPPSFTVLLAADDTDLRLYLAGCLRGQGATHIIEATNGREALLLARTLLPDLVICETDLPDLNGMALCNALKADARTAKIPFLLVNGETRAPPRCADGYLHKPFNASVLRAEVEGLRERLA